MTMPVINIVNKKAHKPTSGDVYCGRGSALGNPFKIGEDGNRDDVCNKYRDHMWSKYLGKNGKSLDREERAQLMEIYQKGVKGEVNLVCYCAPARCHCTTIRDISLNVAERMRRKAAQKKRGCNG